MWVSIRRKLMPAILSKDEVVVQGLSTRRK